VVAAAAIPKSTTILIRFYTVAYATDPVDTETILRAGATVGFKSGRGEDGSLGA
jgi:hypothetical protein